MVFSSRAHAWLMRGTCMQSDMQYRGASHFSELMYGSVDAKLE